MVLFTKSKVTYFQVGEKAADKNDHRETLWSWHRENNLTSLERDLKVHTVAHASTWLPGRIHCRHGLTQTLHCQEERFRSGPHSVCHLSLPRGAVVRWSMPCRITEAQPCYLPPPGLFSVLQLPSTNVTGWWPLGRLSVSRLQHMTLTAEKLASDSSLLVCPSVVC